MFGSRCEHTWTALNSILLIFSSTTLLYPNNCVQFGVFLKTPQICPIWSNINEKLTIWFVLLIIFIRKIIYRCICNQRPTTLATPFSLHNPIHLFSMIFFRTAVSSSMVWFGSVARQQTYARHSFTIWIFHIQKFRVSVCMESSFCLQWIFVIFISVFVCLFLSLSISISIYLFL